VLVAARRWEGLTWGEMGIQSRQIWEKALAGGAMGLGLGAAAVAIILFQPVSSRGVTYAPVDASSWTDLLVRVAATMPVDTIFLEEIAFRGALLALFLRRFRPVSAVALSSTVFMAWHVVINYATVLQTSWAGEPGLLALGLLATYAAVLAGGALFCFLRLWLGSLAAPVAAHWAVNATILVGLQAFT
jgi:membrane protease YdiL (CAAX protease family)